MIQSFEAVYAAVRKLPSRRVAVAAAQDDAILEAVYAAKQMGLADFALIGDAAKIQRLAEGVQADLAGWTIINQTDEKKAAYEAAAMVSRGEADVLMKGLINTADLLRAVLDKDVGLRTGRVLSHTAVFEIPGFDRLLLVADGGMNIAPSLQQKAQILQNAITLARALGMEPAKAAVLAAVEVVNPDMPATLDAAALAKMADRGQIQGALIDGPLALDNAISLAAAKHKGIHSPVAGEADILLTPDIESGNILAKSLVYFAHAKLAGLLLGAANPVIITSRADSSEAKMASIALSVLMEKQ